MGQNTKELKLANVESTKNISSNWVDLWEQIEIWYGDTDKTETGQELLERLQSEYELKKV